MVQGPYECPKCGINTLKIEVNNEDKKAVAHCNSCDLENSLNYVPSYELVDYYNKLIDQN